VAYIVENGLSVAGKPIVELVDAMRLITSIDMIYEMAKTNRLESNQLIYLHRALHNSVTLYDEGSMESYKSVPNPQYISYKGKLVYMEHAKPQDVPYLMGLWFDTYGTISTKRKNLDDCIERYTDMHLSLMAIHPFAGANSRLARMISNVPLLYHNYLPLIISNQEKRQYSELLYAYYLRSNRLDANTVHLVEYNKPYEQIKAFFGQQYKNSLKILEEITAV